MRAELHVRDSLHVRAGEPIELYHRLAQGMMKARAAHRIGGGQRQIQEEFSGM
jgi:hypothetical protein